MKQFDPKKLGEEADEMIRQQSQKPEATETPEEETVEAVEDAEVEGVDAIAQADSTAATDQGVQAEEALGDEEVVDSSKVMSEMQKQIDTAEQRWKVLQGMIAKKDAEIDTMRDLLATMSKQQPQEVATPAQEPAAQLVTDEDVNEYGKEYVDFVARVSAQTLHNELTNNPALASLNERLQRLEGSVQGVAQTSADTAQNIFFNELTTAVPAWRELNNDPSFLKWLDEVDQFAGETRIDLLQHAVKQNDAMRAAKFFVAYQQENAPVMQEQEEASAELSGKEKLVAPGRARATTPRPDAKRNWTRAEIAKLYDDKMQGKITAKEFDKLERDIFAAQSEGRIAA
jgi:hypothetical protein